MPLTKNIAETRSAIASGQLSPRDLVEEALATIDRHDSRVQAWVLVDAVGARREAERIEREVRSGNPVGPLAGILIGVKDIIDIGGRPTKAGSPLREHHVAESDAWVVAALRSAGVILLGKTVTTQFACFDPAPTRNPWNLDHSPGGSSSGSAAAVALGMCHAALGTQTGGSILRPAAFCGIVGFKPSFNAISTQGVVPVSHSLDHVGVLVRDVVDANLIWKALQPPGVHFQAGRLDAPIIGVIDDFYSENMAPWMREAFDATIARAANAGGKVERCSFPVSWEAIRVAHRQIMAVEAAEFHREDYRASPDAYAPGVAALIEEGFRVSRQDYMAALALRGEFATAVSQQLSVRDVLATPATLDAAPLYSAHSTGDPRCNSPFSLSGHPAIAIPAGLSPAGLPWGLQLVGRLHGETDLLRAAEWCQAKLGGV